MIPLPPSARKIARYAYRVGAQFFNPLRWPSVPRELVEYASDLRAFRRRLREEASDAALEVEPIFFNRRYSSPFDTHYTYQAAWAMRLIAQRRPSEHVDISSAVPFVAQLAAIVPVTMYEYGVPSISLQGLTLRQANIVELPMADRSVDSLTCLHVVEHIGLGRFGDPLDPRGMSRALSELARVLKPGGALYLSCPVGRERVAFNAHRVTDPLKLQHEMESLGLRLVTFSWIGDDSGFRDPGSPEDARREEYGCGCYHFTRD